MSTSLRPRVGISGAFELVRFLRTADLIHHGQPAPSIPDSLRPLLTETAPFWPLEPHLVTYELVILAVEHHLEFDLDAGEFVRRLPELTWSGTVGSLSSDAHADRDATAERLHMLGADADLRRRYCEWVAAAWERFEPWWSAEGLPTAQRDAAQLDRQFAEGHTLEQILPIGHPAQAPEWKGLLAFANMRDQLVVSSSVVLPRLSYAFDAGSNIWVGLGTSDDRTPEGARDHAVRVVDVLRPLIDPTRLALLLYLGEHSRGVNQLAEEFDLAPATVSTHLRMLRDAGLVSERAEGKRILFRALAPELRGVLLEAETELRLRV
jgi:DNA-binding transcriptional ArsR family regulator